MTNTIKINTSHLRSQWSQLYLSIQNACTIGKNKGEN